MILMYIFQLGFELELLKLCIICVIVWYITNIVIGPFGTNFNCSEFQDGKISNPNPNCTRKTYWKI